MNTAELLHQLATDPTMAPARCAPSRVALARREVEVFGELTQINLTDRTAAANMAYAREHLAVLTAATDTETRTS
jgi:hypothetical protein